jgi:hypothetical protein
MSWKVVFSILSRCSLLYFAIESTRPCISLYFIFNLFIVIKSIIIKTKVTFEITGEFLPPIVVIDPFSRPLIHPYVSVFKDYFLSVRGKGVVHFNRAQG